MENEAVTDSGPVIHLSELDALNCFRSFRRVWLSAQVREEIDKHVRAFDRALPRFFAEDRLSAEGKRQATLLCLKYSLGLGESTALALAKQKKIELFLADDLDARLTAKELGLQPVGSIGIILRAFRAGLVVRERARELLHGLVSRSSLFVTQALIDKAVQALEAAPLHPEKGKTSGRARI